MCVLATGPLLLRLLLGAGCVLGWWTVFLAIPFFVIVMVALLTRAARSICELAGVAVSGTSIAL